MVIKGFGLVVLAIVYAAICVGSWELGVWFAGGRRGDRYFNLKGRTA